MKHFWHLFSLFCIGMIVFIWVQPAQAQTPIPDTVVRAVLFYSPTCIHCQHVITEVLPPLFGQYGDQLYIVGVDVTQPEGQVLFLAALQYFNVESSGVPFLVLGDTYLSGSIDIPGQLPGMIEQYLANGGVDWPAIHGLAEALAALQPNKSPTNMTLPAKAISIIAAKDRGFSYAGCAHSKAHPRVVQDG